MVKRLKEYFPILGIFISITGILIWLFFILTFRVWWVDPKYELGLFQVLPLYFWLGLLFHLTGTLAGIGNKNKYLFIFQIIILNLMIWGTHVFIEPNARNLDAWQWLGTTRTIMDSNHIVLNNSPTHYYLQWPGSFIFNAILLKITGANNLLYLRFYPLLTTTIFIFGFYLWIRSFVQDIVIRRFTIILFIFLNLWLQFHFSPQAFALMLFPLILISLKKKGFAWRIALMLLIITLIISNPTTTLFLLMIIICLEFVKMAMGFKRGSKNASTQERKTLTRFIVIISICLMIIIINLLLFYRNFTRIFDFDVTINMLSSIFNSRIQRRSSIIRMSILLGVILVAVFTIIQYKKRSEKDFIFTVGWFMGCTIPIFWDLTMEEGHFHDRSIMFAFLLIPLLLVHFIWFIKRLNKVRHIAIVIVILISLTGTYTLYPNENWSIVSDSNLTAAQNVLLYHNERKVFSSKLATIYAESPDINHESFYGYTIASGNNLSADSIVVFDKYTMNLPTTTGESVYDSFKSYESENNHRIYDNNKFMIYLTNE